LDQFQNQILKSQKEAKSASLQTNTWPLTIQAWHWHLNKGVEVGF